eukprot:CAMPEP_0178375776 /NCGR_PEP_ID=MMETSP0689_2-20121128/3065_1 /TAXON_ID=160604 /ORGANISM="Amphidinium massartii, Strain CS-259" /LENGTH=57 /DNA_ID=CAMNT_0019995785 /DNA_START=286 /DNA_END=459 /DNA_ORIENTATION=-
MGSNCPQAKTKQCKRSQASQQPLHPQASGSTCGGSDVEERNERNHRKQEAKLLVRQR